MSAAIFLIALTAIGLMGFATQRGGTCTVAAVEEIFVERRFGRLAALVEASLWVGGGLVLLNVAGLLPGMPVGYAAGATTVVGGALLGIGAFVNRTCAFGSIARLGSGDRAYLATPVGFFLGSLAIIHLPTPAQLAEGSSLLQASAWLAILCILFFAVRLFAHGWTIRRKAHRSTPSHLVAACRDDDHRHHLPRSVADGREAGPIPTRSQGLRAARRWILRQAAAVRRADCRRDARWLDGRTDQACRAELQRASAAASRVAR